MRWLFTILPLLFFSVFFESVYAVTPATHDKADQITQRDVNHLIDQIENPKKREELLKTLKTLKKTQKEPETPLTWIDNVVLQTTQNINNTVHTFVELFVTTAAFPQKIQEAFSQSSFSQSFENLNVFFQSLVLIFGLSFLIEMIGRIILKKIVPALQIPLIEGERTIFDWIKVLFLNMLPIGVFTLSLLITFSVAEPQNLEKILVVVIAVRWVRLISNYGQQLLNTQNKEWLKECVKRLEKLLSKNFQLGIVFLALYEVLRILSFDKASLQAYSKITVFVLLFLSIFHIIDARRIFINHLINSKWITSLPNQMISLILFLGRTWHVYIIILLIGVYLAWCSKAYLLITYFSKGLMGSILVLIASSKLFSLFHKYSAKLDHYCEENGNSVKSTFLCSINSLFPFCRLILGVVSIVFVFQFWGIDWLSLINNKTSQDIFGRIITFLLILGVSKMLWVAVDIIVHYQLRPIPKSGKHNEPTLFQKKIVPVFQTFARWIVGIIALILVLRLLGVPTSDMVYALTFASIAVGMAAQNFIKDIINGFLTLLDGSIAVGDVVSIGSYTGTIEEISLRNVHLRQSNGSLLTIPFSEVGTIINKSRDFTVTFLDVAVSYKSELVKVYEAMTAAFDKINEKVEFRQIVLEPIRIAGVDRLTETAVHILGVVKTLPDPLGRFLREYNRLIKDELDKRGILPPTQHQHIEYEGKSIVG